MWCMSCWAFVEQPSDLSLTEKLLAASANLLKAEMGKDREAFLDHLETVAHLVSVIQYQTHQAAQTKTNEQKET